MKKVITKSGDKLKATVDTVECKAVGDVYNTIVISICADGKLTRANMYSTLSLSDRTR